MVVSNKNSSLLNYFAPFYYFLCAEDSLCLLCLYGWNTISLCVTGHLFPRLSSGHHNGSLKSVLGVLIPLLQIKVTPIAPSKAVLKHFLAHPCATWMGKPSYPLPSAWRKLQSLTSWSQYKFWVIHFSWAHGTALQSYYASLVRFPLHAPDPFFFWPCPFPSNI